EPRVRRLRHVHGARGAIERRLGLLSEGLVVAKDLVEEADLRREDAGILLFHVRELAREALERVDELLLERSARVLGERGVDDERHVVPGDLREVGGRRAKAGAARVEGELFGLRRDDRDLEGRVWLARGRAARAGKDEQGGEGGSHLHLI